MDIGHIPGFVQVVAVSAVHGNDLSIGRIFHDHAYILGAHLFIKSVDVFFYDLLGAHIQSRHNIISVGWFDDGLFYIGILVKISVLASIGSCKGTVVITLHAPVRRISGKSKANGITGQLIKGIAS